MNRYLIPVVLLLLVLSGCTGSKQQLTNVAYRYSESSLALDMEMQVFHFSHDSSTVFLGIDKKDLRFNSKGTTDLSVVLRLFHDPDQKSLPDSLVFQFKGNKMDAGERLMITQSFPFARGSQQLVQAVVRDKLSSKQFKSHELINKSSVFNEHNFLLTKSDSSILFDRFLKIDSEVNIAYRGGKEELFKVHYYEPVRYLALPPFVIKDRKDLPDVPDSTFTIEGILPLDKLGLYFIQAETADTNGISLVCIDNKFPRLSNAEDMIESLRFITRKEEYNKLMAAENPKKAVDKFWLQRAGSTSRGKVLIKEFYGRVQRSNEFFTTFKEGWKTDRGLIFIIYGEPDEVYLTPSGEYWNYNAIASQPSMRFFFERVSSRFTHNYYRLKRNLSYEQDWHKAVFEWRQGVIRNVSRR